VNNWINMAFYQATWLAAVAGAGAGLWWPGVAVFAVFAAWQFAFSDWRRADACLIVGVGALGFAIDSVFAQLELIRFATALPWPTLGPVWMVVLWTSFALALNHSLAFLHRHVLLGAALGASGAPLAYWAAARGWHALSFGANPLLTMSLIAVTWAALVPALAALALRLRGLDTAPLLAAGAHR
jgi:hypothetical protein